MSFKTIFSPFGLLGSIYPAAALAYDLTINQRYFAILFAQLADLRF